MASLRPIQQSSIEKLISAYEAFKTTPGFFLLALDVGQGKTRVVSSFVSRVRANSLLIVIPPSLEKQWVDELRLWGALDVTIIHTPMRARAQTTYPQICIVTSRSLKHLIKAASGAPDLVVVDEPDSIPYSGISTLAGRVMTLLVSSTLYGIHPRGVCNSMWRPLRFFLKGLPEETFPLTISGGEVLEIPDPVIEMVDIEMSGVYGAALASAPQEISHLLEVGAVASFLEFIGCKTSSTSDVFGKIREMISTKIEVTTEKRRRLQPELRVQKEKYDKKIADLVKTIERLDSSLAENLKNCGICCDEGLSVTRETMICAMCLASFCKDCMLEAMKVRIQCPMCRASLGGEILMATDEPLPETPPATLLDALGRLLKKISIVGDHRILISGSHWEVIERSGEMCLSNGVNPIQLHGTVEMREKQLTAFKEGKGALIINANDSSAGMNLPEITHTIILGEESDSMLRQVIGRGQRPGRVNPQNVYILRMVW